MNSRIIKFRGRRIANDEWVYGSLLRWPDGDCTILESKDGKNYVWKRKIEPNTVGQYTGLRDTDGREIYDGDIVRTSVAKDAIGVVEWNNDQASFVVHMKGRTQCYPLSKSDKIIGNIHDNPELLR